MAFITAIGYYIGFSFFRLFDCVERVDGVVLDSSSVSEGREKEDIFLYFIKQRLTNNELIFNSQDVGVILRPNKVIKFPKRLIPSPDSQIEYHTSLTMSS